MYGYIRTSRDQESNRPGMNLETQRRDLLAAGVPERNVHADIDVSGVVGVATRNAWRTVDARLEHGDVLVVAALDRIGRRSRDVMGKIYNLVNRGVRLRSLADDGAWSKGLDPGPESPAHPYPLPLQPGLHPPGPVEGRLQVLPVDLSYQGQVLCRGSPGTVVEAGTAHPQQRV